MAAQAAGHRDGEADRVATAGSIPKAIAYGSQDRAVAFGMLPAVATLSASPPRWPAAWALTAGGLLGVVAHLANVLPDLGDDVATGIRGLPHRIGARATALTAAAILLTASAVIL